MGEDNKPDKIEEKVKPVTIILSVAVIVLALMVIFGAWIYMFGAKNSLARKMSQIIPYPAAIADGKLIRVSDLENNLAASRNFYENQDFSDLGMRVDFSTPDGQKRLKIKERYILTKMIEDAIISAEAQKAGIKLTPDMVSQEVARKMDQFGGKETLKDNMATLYEWSIADFEKNIVMPDMYKEKMLEYLDKNDKSFSASYDKISQAKTELGSGKDFETVVAKYSEGESVKNRGDLGWFSASEMLPEIASTVFGLDKGKTSDIIQSSLGYHIVRLEDKKMEDDQEKVHVKQIFVRKKTLADWLLEKEKEVPVYIPLSEYVWNKNAGEAQFKNKNLQEFESNMEKNSAGDASMMF